MPATMTTTAIRQREGWGLECPEHPNAYRQGLTERHAFNAVAKHNRDHHAEPLFDLTAAAQDVLAMRGGTGLYGALTVFGALVGVPVVTAAGQERVLALAEEYAGAEPPIILVAPPF